MFIRFLNSRESSSRRTSRRPSGAPAPTDSASSKSKKPSVPSPPPPQRKKTKTTATATTTPSNRQETLGVLYRALTLEPTVEAKAKMLLTAVTWTSENPLNNKLGVGTTTAATTTTTTAVFMGGGGRGGKGIFRVAGGFSRRTRLDGRERGATAMLFSSPAGKGAAISSSSSNSNDGGGSSSDSSGCNRRGSARALFAPTR